jgi:hypothetical protein
VEPTLLTKILKYLMENAVSIGTLLGVGVSLLVLREMQKQRRQAYRPHLFLQNQNFWLEKNSNGTPCFMKPLADENKHFYGPPYYLHLENIGVGAAHSIEVAWKYNANRIRKELVRLGSATKRIENDYGTHFLYLFDPSEKMGYGFNIDDPPLEEQVVSYLKSGDDYQVLLPSTIKNYVTFVPYLKLIEQNLPHSVEDRTEMFSVDFTYSDISGKRHTEHLCIDTEIIAFGDTDHEGNYGVGSFSFGTARLMERIRAKREFERQRLLQAADELRKRGSEADP